LKLTKNRNYRNRRHRYYRNCLHWKMVNRQSFWRTTKAPA